MIKYGLISGTDARTLEKTIDLIFDNAEFSSIVFNGSFNTLNILEVGCYAGCTGNAMKLYCESKSGHPMVKLTGIDNNKDGETIRFKYDNLIVGNSNEVYNQIPDNSQHLIFIDGCHTFPAVIADFFCYAPKVKPGAYFAFHDTGSHINPLHGWQGVGDKNDPDFCLGGVRKALKEIGLFAVVDAKTNDIYSLNGEWELIFDEADPNDEAGGITVFKRLY